MRVWSRSLGEAALGGVPRRSVPRFYLLGRDRTAPPLCAAEKAEGGNEKSAGTRARHASGPGDSRAGCGRRVCLSRPARPLRTQPRAHGGHACASVRTRLPFVPEPLEDRGHVCLVCPVSRMLQRRVWHVAGAQEGHAGCGVSTEAHGLGRTQRGTSVAGAQGHRPLLPPGASHPRHAPVPPLPCRLPPGQAPLAGFASFR